MLNKLKSLKKRYEELTTALSSPDAMADQDKWLQMTKEQVQLEQIVTVYDEYVEAVDGEADCKAMLEDHLDADMKDMVHAEINALQEKQAELESKLRIMLLPKDPNDEKNVIIEIRAGTGGDEASLFGADLLRMYMRYAERHNFKTEFLTQNMTEMGGVKEVALSLSGKMAYSRMKYESGVHRVQRVPETESQGRIHTSAATVAVMPEAEDVDVQIEQKDLKIDTYCSSGAGGQHVNKTSSAIRITHLPTGVVVQCQDERSQLKNKEKAMRVLKSRLYEMAQAQHDDAEASKRKSMVGSGDRSERIRTYNFPQNRVSDHRINLTLYRLEAFMDGDMDEMIDALILAERTAQLSGEAQA
ncbi:MAG: peptide chain release factor 1 [Clostridia bacterium]|nr:peptide chain release factor 1 [Clostridia bacterium]